MRNFMQCISTCLNTWNNPWYMPVRNNSEWWRWY